MAEVITHLWGGFAVPFPSFPDSWMAVSGDARGIDDAGDYVAFAPREKLRALAATVAQ